MADLGKISPTKPIWPRVGETPPEENNPHPQQHPDKEDNKKETDEVSEKNKRPADPDDEHEIDLFV